MSLELFRPIDGFSKYMITSWGRVYSLADGIFLKQQENEKGYLRVDIVDDAGIKRHKKVHRLVAEAFIQNENGYPQVNHIDGNKQNNSFTNLEWVTNEENARKAKELRCMQRSLPERFNDHGFTVEQYEKAMFVCTENELSIQINKSTAIIPQAIGEAIKNIEGEDE